MRYILGLGTSSCHIMKVFDMYRVHCKEEDTRDDPLPCAGLRLLVVAQRMAAVAEVSTCFLAASFANFKGHSLLHFEALRPYTVC